MGELDKSISAKNKQGNIAIIIALLIVVFMSITALSIDIGYALVTRSQLQMVSDSSALAAARVLGHTYEGMSFEQQQVFVADPVLLTTTAQQTALMNKAGGKYIIVNASDVIIGKWDGVGKTLTPTLNSPDAVQVTARRDASANGPITTFFARIFGITTIKLTAVAIAALTGQTTTNPGGLPLPLGISTFWFSAGGGCDQPIKFYPTGDLAGCAGWNTYTDFPANAAKLKNILQGLTNGTFTSPQVIANQTIFNFTGGTVSSDFSYMQTLFDTMKVKNDGVFDLDQNSATWTTSVPVYNLSDCSNPTGPILIVGLATATITSVVGAPSKVINAVVKCNFVSPGRGGGQNFGTKGSIPGLVK